MGENKETKVRRKTMRSAPAYIPHEEQFLLYYDASLERDPKVEASRVPAQRQSQGKAKVDNLPRQMKTEGPSAMKGETE